MSQAGLTEVLGYLRRIWAVREARDVADAELLNRFVDGRDESAFAVLVQRHGPMVSGVCRRVLKDVDAADDAFQATFMVLVRRANSIKRGLPLANWLYGVAQRIALKARSRTMARRQREKLSDSIPNLACSPTSPVDELNCQELRAILDEEIAQLPEKCRVPLVLCYFGGKTHEQAAKELSLAKRTLTSRVAQGRELLRQQLVRRGMVFSAGALAAALGQSVNAGPLGAILAMSTVRAAMSWASGKSSLLAQRD